MNQCPAKSSAIVCLLATSLFGSVVHATDALQDFSRYQIIIDRSPFGPISGTENVPQPPFSARFNFVGTVKEDDAKPLLAIIIDKEHSETYFKAEGDTIGDTTVVKIEKADKAQVKLVLKQGLEVATLFLETKTSVGAAPPPASAPPQPVIPGVSPAPVPPQPGVRRIPFRRGG